MEGQKSYQSRAHQGISWYPCFPGIPVSLFERFCLCLHAKIDPNTIILRPKLELTLAYWKCFPFFCIHWASKISNRRKSSILKLSKSRYREHNVVKNIYKHACILINFKHIIDILHLIMHFNLFTLSAVTFSIILYIIVIVNVLND